MKVLFTRDSREDLAEIAEYIAADSPKYARRVAAALRSNALDLSAMSERFPVVGMREGQAIRRRAHESYSIFYYVEDGRHVVIVRILHSARDHERILFPED